MSRTAMGREWAAHIDAGRHRRARMVPDGSVPGLWRPANVTPPPLAPRAPQRLRGPLSHSEETR